MLKAHVRFIYKPAPLPSWKGSLNTCVIPKAVLQPAATASSPMDSSHTPLDHRKPRFAISPWHLSMIHSRFGLKQTKQFAWVYYQPHSSGLRTFHPKPLPGLSKNKCTYTKVHVLIKSTPSYIALSQEAPQLMNMWVMVGVGDRLPSRCCRCGGTTSICVCVFFLQTTQLLPVHYCIRSS